MGNLDQDLPTGLVRARARARRVRIGVQKNSGRPTRGQPRPTPTALTSRRPKQSRRSHQDSQASRSWAHQPACRSVCIPGRDPPSRAGACPVCGAPHSGVDRQSNVDPSSCLRLHLSAARVIRRRLKAVAWCSIRVFPILPIVQAKAALPWFGHAQIVLPAQWVWEVLARLSVVILLLGRLRAHVIVGGSLLGAREPQRYSAARR